MSLRARLGDDRLLMALGAWNAITAKMAAQAGAEAVYMSGSCVGTSLTGEPDVGLVTMPEMAEQARRMAAVIDVPLIADGDTGYGNPINVRRTIREYERAGVAAIQLEDQTFPKKCGHFEGKDVVPAPEFAAKIAAATDAREDDDFLIIARTDALAVHGIEEAIRRARMYADAGADVLFVEAPTDRDQMTRIIDEAPGHHLANMAAKGKTPPYPADDLEALGYDLAIYPSDAFKAGLAVYQNVYETLVETRRQEPILDDMMAWEERDRITDLDEIYALEDRYAEVESRYEGWDR